MKSSQWHSRLSVSFFLLTLALALFSWVGSVYGVGEVQSLLSAEGVRWVLGHVVSNYVQMPALGVALILLMGFGIVQRSGLYDVLKRLFRKEGKLSRKERRALTVSFIALAIYAVLIGVCLLLPWNLLLGVTGSWLYSPLVKGSVYLLSVGVGLAGVIYGYATDTFRCVDDCVKGMRVLIAHRASFFVTLFFVVQFFSSLSYTNLVAWLHVPDGVVEILFQICCYLPLFL